MKVCCSICIFSIILSAGYAVPRTVAGISGSVETLVSGSLGHLGKESSVNTGSSN